MPRLRPLAVVVIVWCSVIALSTLAAGIDYFSDCLGIDELLRGNLEGFFQMQPMQGPVSLLVRAPFVALVFHSDIDTVYYMGLIPCYAALLVLTRVLWVRMEGRPTVDRLLVALLCIGSPFVVKAVHWGHPEELLATALTLGALFTAARGRPVLAGAMLGTAYATKQWAVIAGLPILLSLPPRHRVRFTAACVGFGALFVVPMILGDPQRFLLVTRDAGSAVPGLRLEHATMPGVRVLPQSFWTPFTSPLPYGGLGYRFTTSLLSPVAHPLLVVAGLPFAYTLWRRHGRLTMLMAARLLALALLLRCWLDPNNLDYYHVPLISTLAVVAALGGERDLRAALYATAGMALAFVQPATKMQTVATDAWLKYAVYTLAVVPLAAWLIGDLYDVRFAYRARRSARTQAA